jgi:hypothetical protein
MGRKNHNQEESGSGVKKEERPNRLSLNVDLSRAMHEKWLLCNWVDVHLPGGSAIGGCPSSTPCLLASQSGQRRSGASGATSRRTFAPTPPTPSIPIDGTPGARSRPRRGGWPDSSAIATTPSSCFRALLRRSRGRIRSDANRDQNCVGPDAAVTLRAPAGEG